MKVLYLFIPIFGFLLSCQSTESTQSNEKKAGPQKTMLFLDKSASLQSDQEYVSQKYQDQIRLLLQKGIQQAGDEIEVFYLHENTLKGKSLHLVAKTPTMDTENMNPTDVESAELDYSLQIGKERLAFEKKILTLVNEENHSLSNQMTDISASLALLNERNTGTHALTAFFFSDMLESTRNGRNFHVKKPASQEESKRWAAEDAEKYKDINLQNVSLVMVLPFNPLSSSQSNDPLITLYWKTLFENLGALSIEEL